MKTTIIATIILFIAGLIFCSCNNNDCDDVIVTISQERLLRVVPYTGNETLWFLKNKQDTLAFVGEGRKTTNTRVKTQSPCDEYEQLPNVNTTFFSAITNQYIGYDYYIMSRANGNVAEVNLNYNKQQIGNYSHIYFATFQSPPQQDIACGIVYDTVSFFTHDLGKLTFKPGFGIIKFSINNDTYELIP